MEGEAYQERGDGGVSEGAEAAEVGVGDEGADERREVGGAGEDVDDVGRRHLLDVEALHQVHRQVGRQAVRRHPLEALISCARSKQLTEVAAKLSSSKEAILRKSIEETDTDNVRHALPPLRLPLLLLGLVPASSAAATAGVAGVHIALVKQRVTSEAVGELAQGRSLHPISASRSRCRLSGDQRSVSPFGLCRTKLLQRSDGNLYATL